MGTTKATVKTTKHDGILKEVRAYGLAFPGAHVKSPWPGHLDLAVKDKTFAYLSLEGEPFGVGVKLPRSGEMVKMAMPNAKPTEYGLGKSGWVSVQFAANESVPVELVKEWLDESYRAQAPKKLVAERDAQSTDVPAKRAPAKKAVTKKAAKKRAPTKKMR